MICFEPLDLGGNMVASLPDGRTAVFSEDPTIGEGPALFIYAAGDDDMERPTQVTPCQSIDIAQRALEAEGGE